jgi:outer membrane autotransporter protein
MATRAVTHVSGGRPAESMKVLLMLLAHAGSGVCLLTAIDGSVVHAQTSAMGFCQTDHSDSPFTPLGKEFGSTERQTIRCTPTDQGSGEEIKGNTGIQSRFRPRDDIPASQVRQEGNNIDLVIDPGVIFRSNLATVGLGSGVSIVNSGILETTGGTFAYGISLGRNGRLQAGGNSIVNTALGIIRTSGTGSTAIFVDASLASSGGNQIINEGVIQATGRDSHGIRLITGANNAANLIDNSGSITVEAPGMAGILLESLRGSTDRIVNSGSIESSGAEGRGIAVKNDGNVASNQVAIENEANGVVSASGVGGVGVEVVGSGNVTNAGRIEGSLDGVRLLARATSGVNTISNSGVIVSLESGGAGVRLESEGSNDRIVNSGSIESSGAEGRGIAVRNDGSVASNQVAIENEANGVVSASGVGGVGVEVVGSGNVTNAGRIEGSLDGVRLLARATSGVNTISNSGVIVSLESGGAGVRLESEGSNDRIVNSGSIESSGAEGRGIAVRNDGSVASNQVAIENEANGVVSASGVGGVGVEVVGSGNVTNAGRIEGSLDGVRLLARATSGVNTISNSGVIVSLESGGAGVRLESEGSNDRIVNSGSIESSGAEGRGIAVRNDGSVASNQVAIENEANGVVSASGVGGVGVEVVGSGNVTNAGRIEGSLDGVRLLARATSGVNTISNSGVIVSLESGGAGVRLESEGSNDRIVNSGSIESSGAEGRGIAVRNDGSVASNQVAIENEANGVVSASGAGGVGVEVLGSALVLNRQGGRIQANSDGLRLNNADRLRSMELINAGQIFSSSSYGVNVLGSAIVENEAGGLIQGDAYGVNIDDLGTGSASVLINQPGGRIIGLRNASTIRLTREEDFAGRFVDLRIDGPYLGENGVLLMNTEIAGDDAPSDRLTVSGSTIRGFTTLRISNIDGLGASTIKNGILLVNAIEGATSQAGSFGLSGPIEVGPYAYYLFKGGVTAGSEESWFLRNSLPTLPETISDAGNRPGGNGGGAAPGTTTERPSGGGGSGSGSVSGSGAGSGESAAAAPTAESTPGLPDLPPITKKLLAKKQPVPIFRTEVPVYAALSGVSRQLSQQLVGTFNDRFGDQQALRQLGQRGGTWVRGFGGSTDLRWKEGAQPEFDGYSGGIQIGQDLAAWQTSVDSVSRVGVFFAYGKSKGNVRGLAFANPGFASGTLDLDSYGIGVYGNYVSPANFYVDAVMMASMQRVDLSSVQGMRESTEGEAFAVSLETGYPIQLGPRVTLEPQAQVIGQYQSFDSLTDRLGKVKFNSNTTLVGRVGLFLQGNFGRKPGRFAPYARVNLWQQFNRQDSVVYNGVTAVANGIESTTLQLGVGVDAQVAAGLSLYGGIDLLTSVSGNEQRDVQGNLGLRFRF